ncbi:hypothetical protein [Acidibrevibacterium fodinaquatile]|uniref:hypothetical protein n=1 Tax=Acidibrevibacterium fodinaquatile TaxID=1969806 RepID=UPI0013B40EAF|nr:hypothetical protein [Acidibrevibacterium fodinaquatile]
MVICVHGVSGGGEAAGHQFDAGDGEDGIDRLTQPGMLLAPSDRWKREYRSIKSQIIDKNQKFVAE